MQKHLPFGHGLLGRFQSSGPPTTQPAAVQRVTVGNTMEILDFKSLFQIKWIKLLITHVGWQEFHDHKPVYQVD